MSRFRFVHVPRTGGQSVREALGVAECEIHLPAPEHRRRDPHARLFTFVRNPWDRAVSIYAFFLRGRTVEPDGFRRWVADGLPHPSGQAATLYAGEPYAIDVTAPQARFCEGGVDWMGRYETLAQDFRDLRSWLGLMNRPVLPHVNASAHPPPTDLYDDCTLNRIGELYREDIEWLGYQTPTSESGG